MTPELKAQIIELHSRGLCDPAISKALGRPRSTIALYRNQLGLKPNPHQRSGGRPRGANETNGVHWSKALTLEQWEVVKLFFALAIRRKTFGRFAK